VSRGTLFEWIMQVELNSFVLIPLIPRSYIKSFTSAVWYVAVFFNHIRQRGETPGSGIVGFEFDVATVVADVIDTSHLIREEI
jgi:hypothetical protein